MRTLSPLPSFIFLPLLAAACSGEPTLTEPGLKAGNGAATPLTASPSQLRLTLPPGTPATLTARVQYVGTIMAVSSDASGCAAVSPASVPASKPAGSSVYLATFTVTPTGLGSCLITLQDKKGKTAEVPVIVEGAVSGGRIVYASSRTGNLDIYMIGTSGSVRLTSDDAFDRDPTLSPDGTKIAFASNRGGGSTNIWLMNADGTDPVQLTDLAGGAIQPAFSPDGSKIVFASYEEDYQAGKAVRVTDLWVMNADGTGQAQLTFIDPYGAGSPRYSPDGTKIVFAVGFHIWLMDADGNNAQQLTTQEDNFTPSFSPDGTKIVYASDVGATFSDVWLMNADGSSPQRLTFANSGAGTPTFSPDGTRIVFGSTRNGNDDIYMIEANGSNEVRLTADPGQDVTPRFGP